MPVVSGWIWTTQQNWVKTSSFSRKREYFTFQCVPKYFFNLKYAYRQCIRTLFLLTKGKCTSIIEFNVWREVVLNLFHDSRTPLDSIRDKLVTLIYLWIVQCPSVGTTWYSASYARNGWWAASNLRISNRQTLEVFAIVKVLFRIPQLSPIVKIRK